MTTEEGLRRYRPLVLSIALDTIRRGDFGGIELDDLIAAGNLGLLYALRSGSTDNPRFAGFAANRIRWAIGDELRRQDWIGRRLRKKLGHGRSAVVALENEMVCELEDRVDTSPLQSALEQLSDEQRNLLTRHYFGGTPFAVMAKQAGISRPRMSQIHTEALRRMKEALENA